MWEGVLVVELSLGHSMEASLKIFTETISAFVFRTTVKSP